MSAIAEMYASHKSLNVTYDSTIADLYLDYSLRRAELTSDLEGQISRIITLSYAVTPLISFPVTAALAVVREMDEGHRI